MHGTAVLAGQNDVAFAVGQARFEQFVPFAYSHSDNAVGAGAAVCFQGGLLDDALLGTQHHEVLVEVLLACEIRNVQVSDHLVVAFQLDQVDDRPALALAVAFGDIIDPHPVTPALLGEDEQVVVVGRHEQVFEEILIPRGAPAAADPAPALGAEFGE